MSSPYNMEYKSSTSPFAPQPYSFDIPNTNIESQPQPTQPLPPPPLPPPPTQPSTKNGNYHHLLRLHLINHSQL